MATKVAIIGAGPGGYIAAVRAAQLGAEVSLVERDNVGGTCLNRGCIPSKVMLTTAEMLEKFRRAQEFGLRLDGGVSPDMGLLAARKARVIQDQSKGILDLLGRNKVEYLRGKAIVSGHGSLTVQSPDGQIREVAWDKLIVATGTQPFEFPAIPFEAGRILSSDDVLSLQEIPKSVMILGGGVIGCEFAFMLGMLGSEVTLVEAMDRLLPLPSVDEDCSKVLQREMKKRKIKFIVSRTVTSVEKDAEKLRVTLGSSPFSSGTRDEKPVTVEIEKLVVCIGRSPNTAGLGLEKLGTVADAKGWITVNERMETNVPGVYAVGDILGPSRIMLAHVASTEGLVAAENAMGGNRVMEYDVVPGAIFTVPEIANVGLTETGARRKGLPVGAASVLFRTIGKAQITGDIAGEAKIVFNSESGKILGVHIIGPHATDLIAEGTLAVKMGATVRDLAETIHAHPTLPEVMSEASFRSLEFISNG